MSKLYFRPNAHLSTLFSDVPNEGISIEEDVIYECITDYHGSYLVEKDEFAVGDRPSVDMLKTLIMSFDDVAGYIDSVPTEDSYEALCIWLAGVLQQRGWIPMQDAQPLEGEQIKCVNGQQLFFEMEID
jgi:hypothetical protein